MYSTFTRRMIWVDNDDKNHHAYIEDMPYAYERMSNDVLRPVPPTTFLY